MECTIIPTSSFHSFTATVVFSYTLCGTLESHVKTIQFTSVTFNGTYTYIQTLLLANRVFKRYVPVAMAPIPERTAVLCRQFPTAIQRAVSSPSLDGSTTIMLQPASKARSSSNSNVSCEFSLSYTSRMMATWEGSNSLWKRNLLSKLLASFHQTKWYLVLQK